MKKWLGRVVLEYLRLAAKLQLLKVRLRLRLDGKRLTVVGITGSAGKTSTLLATQQLLAASYRVKSNHGSNSESGIPLDILGLKISDFSLGSWASILAMTVVKLIANWEVYDIYLAEMGIDEPDEPKNMGYLLKIIKPDIAVFLGVNPVHSMQFDKTVSKRFTGKERLEKVLFNIAVEKARIINHVPRPRGVVINSDDPLVTKSVDLQKIEQIVTIGQGKRASVRIESSKVGPAGFRADYVVDNQKVAVVITGQALPDIYKISLAAALGVGKLLGLEPTIAARRLAYYQPPPGRSGLLVGANDSRIIGSTYNSSPGTAQEMIALLSAFPKPRVAIPGDMRELGEQNQLAHKELYDFVKDRVDMLISVGPETGKYFGEKAIKFKYWWEAADYLKNNSKLTAKASILVKGPQNTIYLEELVATLLANPQDRTKLCRQSDYWVATKRKFRKINSA